MLRNTVFLPAFSGSQSGFFPKVVWKQAWLEKDRAAEGTERKAGPDGATYQNLITISSYVALIQGGTSL